MAGTELAYRYHVPSLVRRSVKGNELLAALRGGEPAPARGQAITQALTAIAARANDHGMPPWPSLAAGQNT